jgi:hypothetical protein
LDISLPTSQEQGTIPMLFSLNTNTPFILFIVLFYSKYLFKYVIL